MRYNVNSTIDQTKLHHIATWAADALTIDGARGLGVIESFAAEWDPQLPGSSTYPASAELQTSGESRVVAGGEVVPGDWFASDVAGRAVPTSTGFALGRILEPGSAGDLVACVITPTEL